MAEPKRAGISLNSRLRIPKLPLDILFEIPLGRSGALKLSAHRILAEKGWLAEITQLSLGGLRKLICPSLFNQIYGGMESRCQTPKVANSFQSRLRWATMYCFYRSSRVKRGSHSCSNFSWSWLQRRLRSGLKRSSANT